MISNEDEKRTARDIILEAALRKHDEDGCTCDRRYVMSCMRLAQAVLVVGSRSSGEPGTVIR